MNQVSYLGPSMQRFFGIGPMLQGILVTVRGARSLGAAVHATTLLATHGW